MEPMFSLKLGIDLTSGLAAGATLGSLAPSIDLWAASIASFSISVVVGIVAGYIYYKRFDKNQA
jgi:membrane protein implicated in regulation of membrane protease activity